MVTAAFIVATAHHHDPWPPRSRWPASPCWGVLGFLSSLFVGGVAAGFDLPERAGTEEDLRLEA